MNFLFMAMSHNGSEISCATCTDVVEVLLWWLSLDLILVDSCSYKVSINMTSTTETPMDIEGAISRAELKQVLKNHPLKKIVKDTDSIAWRNSHTKKQVERPPLINQDTNGC